MKRFIYYLSQAFLLLILNSSCLKQPIENFESNPSERINQRIAEALSLIATPNQSWVLYYYPHESRIFGGYTLFLKFTEEGKVSISNDLELGQIPIESDFRIIAEQGPLLSFNSFNKNIHYFSEPGGDSGMGPVDTGMGGDFEFIVMEASATLFILKGKRTGTILEMHAIEDELLAPTRTAYYQASEQFNSFITLNYIKADGELIPMLLNDRTLLIPSYPDLERMSFRVTETGLDFFENQELDGISFKTLIYRLPTAEFPLGYYANEGNQIRFAGVAPNLNQILNRSALFTSLSNMGPLGDLYWSFGHQQLVSSGINTSSISIGSSGGQQGLFFRTSGIFGDINGVLNFTFVPIPGTTNEVRMVFEYTISGASAEFFNLGFVYILFPFHDLFNLIDREFIISEGPEFPVSSWYFEEKTYPSNYFTLYSEQIVDPFNN